MVDYSAETSNINISSERLLLPPRALKAKVPLSAQARNLVLSTRETLRAILRGTDQRLCIVVGPCSIHNEEAALDYAARLKALSDEVQDTLVLVMRAYFEKPRTSVGWKGFINDPQLNDSFDIELGLERARKLLLDLATLGVPVGTEALDPVTPQYLDDLISWSAIGARTTESQTHREMASGLSTPVGFKNGTDGNIQVAINAMTSASSPHRFLGINQDGQCAVLETRGNGYTHVVLRGGHAPNYDAAHIEHCEKALLSAKIPPRIVVDCSHGNTNKDYTKQPAVFRDCVDQIVAGNRSIVGMMLESHLHAGSQPPNTLDKLKYGVSITDACIAWDTTEQVIQEAARRLRPLLAKRELLAV